MDLEPGDHLEGHVTQLSHNVMADGTGARHVVVARAQMFDTGAELWLGLAFDPVHLHDMISVLQDFERQMDAAMGYRHRELAWR
jgi:hypothetical protein